MREEKLVEALCAELQANYEKYQNECYFIKIEKSPNSDGECHLAWVKFFSDDYALYDYYYDTEYMRACIQIKFSQGRYGLLCAGFYYNNRHDVWADKTTSMRSTSFDGETENIKMIPREIVEKGFGEITTEFKKLKNLKAV